MKDIFKYGIGAGVGVGGMLLAQELFKEDTKPEEKSSKAEKPEEKSSKAK